MADLKLHIVSVSYQKSVNPPFFDFSQVLLRFEAQFSSKPLIPLKTLQAWFQAAMSGQPVTGATGVQLCWNSAAASHVQFLKN